MASSTHQFGVLDLIRAGLQDLDTARTLLDELRADGIDDDRLCLLMKTLEQTCEPDIALRNLVDIIKALQSQGRDFHQVITDDAGLVRLVTVLGVSDGMGKLMRFRPELVMAAASDSCESHLYNHAQRRAHVLEAVGADPADNRMPKATKPLAEAATALTTDLQKTARRHHGAGRHRGRSQSKYNRESARNCPILPTRPWKARSPSPATKWTAANTCASPSSAWASSAHANSTTYPTWTSSTWWNRRTRTPTA